VAKQIEQGITGQDEDLGEDFVGFRAVIVGWWRLIIVIENGVRLMQSPNCSRQRDVQDDEGGMVRLSDVGEGQNDFDWIHDAGSAVGGSSLTGLVPRRLARAAPARCR